MNVIGLVKKHPYISAGAVFAIGLILVLALSGGSAQSDGGGTGVAVQPLPGANSGAYDASVALGTIQGQVAAYGIDAEKAIALDMNATDLAKARSGFEMMNNANILAATVATHGLDVSQNIAGIQTKRDVDVANVNANAAMTINRDQVSGALAMNAQNVSVAQSVANQNYQIELNKIMSNERLQDAAMQHTESMYNTGASVDLTKNAQNTAVAQSANNMNYQIDLSRIMSNERLGAEAIRTGSFGMLGVSTSTSGTITSLRTG